MNALILVLALLPTWPATVIAAKQPMSSKPGLIVSVHSPKTAPKDFYVVDPKTGVRQPYLLFDESNGANTRIRVRIRAATVVGFQDFVFDSASKSMSIEAGDEILLERFEVVTEERQGNAPWKRLAEQSQQFSYTQQPQYAEIVWAQQLSPAVSRKTTFRIGFDGVNPIHTIDSELLLPNGKSVQLPDKAQNKSALRRSWFKLTGLPASVDDRAASRLGPASEDDGDVSETLSFGQLSVEWLGTNSGPIERSSSSARTMELSPSDAGTASFETMSLSLGALASGNTITVTSPGQFEVVFSSTKGGGIQYWFDLANDPGRTRNLVYNNSNLFAHRIKVGGTFYFTSKIGQMELVSQDDAKVVVRQFGTYAKSKNSSLSGTTFDITYTIWAAGQVGLHLNNTTSVARTVTIEEQQLQVSGDPWQGIDQFGNVNGNSTPDRFSDYVGFYANSGAGTTFNADVVLAPFIDWANASQIFYRSQSAGRAIGWKSSSSATWDANSQRDTDFLLLLKPDSLNGFDQPLPYVVDYRNPAINVTTGTDNGFDAGAAAYRIQASTNHATFTVGDSVARYQPRFAISNWGEPDYKLSQGGTLLVNGSDYVGDFDQATLTLNIEFLGNQPSGGASEFVLEPTSNVPRISHFSPPAQLQITDEGGTFVIPYIQESTTLEAFVNASNVPAGGGIEFVLDGNSTFDMSPPFSQSLNTTPGDHALDAYIVDSAQVRLENPEAHQSRPQVGIGTLYATIGDSLTAGNFGDSTISAVSNCAQSPSWSIDCRNFFQHSASGGVWYRGYQVTANDCLTTATGAAQFLMNDGYGGIKADGILDRMDVYTTRIQQLGLSRVLLLVGTNDANQLVPVNTWKSNVEAIIANLVGAGIEPQNIYLGYVPYRLGNSQNAIARRQRMQEYNAQIPSIAASTGISIGPDFFTYYQNHQDMFAEGDSLHLNQTGYDAMGGLWTQSITGSSACVP